jgi:hypothetical protein
MKLNGNEVQGFDGIRRGQLFLQGRDFLNPHALEDLDGDAACLKAMMNTACSP